MEASLNDITFNVQNDFILQIKHVYCLKAHTTFH
jgi:hypothetical protein